MVATLVGRGGGGGGGDDVESDVGRVDVDDVDVGAT